MEGRRAGEEEGKGRTRVEEKGEIGRRGLEG